MAAKTKTASDKYFDSRMKEPEFASAYAGARSAIDSIDSLIRVLDAARTLAGVSKADLAREIEARQRKTARG